MIEPGEASELNTKRGFVRRTVERFVDVASKYPYLVILVALAIIASSWTYASHLELHSDMLELLPRDSPGFMAFEHQLGRVGGRATLIVVVESPDRKANEHFIDDLSAKLQAKLDAQNACLAACGKADNACRAKCGPVLVSYLETGTKDVRKFFEDNKWLYADLQDLKDADETLDHQVAIQSNLVPDFDDDDDDDAKKKSSTDAGVTAPATTNATDGGTAAQATADGGAKQPVDPDEKLPALGMDSYRERWKAKANKNDDFPTGYFATEDGTMMGMRLISPSTGMGDRGGDLLMEQVRKATGELDLKSYNPQMQIGFAGDIPNVIAEKESIVNEAAGATGIAFVLILGGIVLFFRSPWSLPIIAFPTFIGVGAAYSFAMATYGFVNVPGAFLGAIILGNGINYPIVLLSRYREFRARGMPPDVARRGAVWNAFRAELVGASVGSIAYGSLSITRFRGFNQFGAIGFVGMLLVWLSMIPVVPALIVIVERLQLKLPTWLRDPEPKIDLDGSKGVMMKIIARTTERRPWLWIGIAFVLTVVAAVRLPSFLKDPWEYNFDHLDSKTSHKAGGVGVWSNKAEKVFGGKMNIAGALMLADTPDQVPKVKAQILANDAADKDGQLIAEVATIEDLLPGTDAEQQAKLDVLADMRTHLSEGVISRAKEEEQPRLREIKPPETLSIIHPKDLPPLLRRRFEENDGRVGTVFYVKFKNTVSFADGHNMLRIAKTTDNVRLPDGTVVQTASHSTIFAEIIRSMERDGPLATFASFFAVMLVVIIATASRRGAIVVLASLVMGVTWMLGGAAYLDARLNFINFIALPITFGIGCEYPFNVFDRSRLLKGDVSLALRRTGGAVALCSFTTIIGYGSLLFSDQQALDSFGRLAMSGKLACLAAALLVLPSLLHVWKQKKSARDKVETSDTEKSAQENSA